LRKLEEMELRQEREDLLKERAELDTLLNSKARQKTRMKKDLAGLLKTYGADTELGRRRTSLEEAAPPRDIPLEAMIEKEPITVVMSERGWIRAMKGHVDAAGLAKLKYKEGDGPAFDFPAQTTDKLLLAADDGRIYTLGGDKLPGARGFGEPVRSMVDIEDGAEIVGLVKVEAGGRLLLASSAGKGFVVKAEEIVSTTRKGKVVVNVKAGAKLRVVRPIPEGADHVAAIGENRKLLIFALDALPEMARGQGIMLQKYKDGGLSDALAFTLDEGLSWAMGGDTGRTRTETELGDWIGNRGTAGRMPPRGFPQDNRFG
jgi:topoisomerase-4 subunit A